MGFLDDIKNKAGDAFEAAKDKAADIADTVKDKLDSDDDGDVDTADASHAFESLKDRNSGGEEAPVDEGVAADPLGPTGLGERGVDATDPIPDPDLGAPDPVADPTVPDSTLPESPAPESPVPGSAEAARDDALGAVSETARDVRSDSV